MTRLCDSWDSFVEPDSAPGCLLLLLEHAPVWKEVSLLGLRDWSPEDLARLGRFRHDGARTSWALSRHLFRSLYSRWFGVPWRDEGLAFGPYGKPFLRNGELKFNWSHTGGAVALLVSLDHEVGCDVEDLRAKSQEYRDIAESCFSEDERNWIEASAGENGPWQRFLTLFVEREARGKADGRGLVLEWDGPASERKDAPFRTKQLDVLILGTSGRYLVAASTMAPVEPVVASVRSFYLTEAPV